MKAIITINPEAIKLAESDDPEEICWDDIELAVSEALWNLKARLSKSTNIKPRDVFYAETDEVLCVTLDFEA